MHLIKKINYIDGYKISLTFDDKQTKVVNLERYLDKGVFLPLKDPDYFQKVTLIDGTIVWPNEADFCADVLYDIGRKVKENKTQFSKHQQVYKKSTRNPHLGLKPKNLSATKAKRVGSSDTK